MQTITTQLQPTPPFNFNLTAEYHTYSAAAGALDSGVYRRLLNLNGQLALASVRSTGAVDAPDLTLELQGPSLTNADAEQAAAQVRWMLGTAQDLAPFYALAESDPALSGLAQQFRGLHLPRAATLFEAVTLAVLGQQISASVARMMRILLIQRFGAQAQFGSQTWQAFPCPQAILSSTPAELRTLKLTQRKAEYIHGIAAAALEPSWAELYELPDAEIITRLTALRGVGHWTAQWALVRGLARPDALPLGDLALRRGVSRLWCNNHPTTDAQVATQAETWRPYRSYATAYLFAAMRSGMV